MGQRVQLFYEYKDKTSGTCERYVYHNQFGIGTAIWRDVALLLINYLQPRKDLSSGILCGTDDVALTTSGVEYCRIPSFTRVGATFRDWCEKHLDNNNGYILLRVVHKSDGTDHGWCEIRGGSEDRLNWQLLSYGEWYSSVCDGSEFRDVNFDVALRGLFAKYDIEMVGGWNG